jgi:hypothetical protein
MLATITPTVIAISQTVVCGMSVSSERSLTFPKRGADPFELGNIILSFHFARLDPHLSSQEMKAARKRTSKPSPLLEAALDAALVIVVGYALILLSQFQTVF